MTLHTQVGSIARVVGPYNQRGNVMKHHHEKPDVCPECGNDYLARIPKRLDTRIKVVFLYRHRTKGYVYLHQIPLTR